LRRVAEILLERGTHGFRHVAVEPLENGEQLVDDERLLLGARGIVLEEVKRERAREVCRIEVNDVLIALRRDGGEDIKDVGSVRIDEAAALAVLDVLDDERL